MPDNVSAKSSPSFLCSQGRDHSQEERRVRPMKAISVRQPWAWLIIHGGKFVENRDWYTAYKGPLAILASKGMTRAEYDDAVDFVRHWDAALADRIPAREELVYGAALGKVMMTGCVRNHVSWWFQGKFGHVYEDAEAFPVPIPATGRLGLFDWSPHV